jgi:uncharacterized protein (TIGR00255 family)
MIRSMTGFGRAEVPGDRVAAAVEAKSVNHRHLDVVIKMPRAFSAFESEARRLVQERLDRGRVEIHVSITPTAARSAHSVNLDVPLARAYAEIAYRLGDELTMTGGPSLSWILERPGVVRLEEAEEMRPGEEDWPVVAEALRKAVAELQARRETEGEALAAQLRSLHEALVAEVGRIAARLPEVAARREERFRERVQKLAGEIGVDQSRILTEIAVWAEKSDVAEELARLGSHLEQFALMLKDGGAIGRPLDFLIQELNREVNTIGSKADALEISQSVMAAKGILEKVREQVQNLE